MMYVECGTSTCQTNTSESADAVEMCNYVIYIMILEIRDCFMFVGNSIYSSGVAGGGGGGLWGLSPPPITQQ